MKNPPLLRNRNLTTCLLFLLTPQLVLGEDLTKSLAAPVQLVVEEELGKPSVHQEVQDEDISIPALPEGAKPVASSEATVELQSVTVQPTVLTLDEQRRFTIALDRAVAAEQELGKKIESCFTRMHRMRATITEIKEIQVDVETVVYELKDRQGKLLGRVYNVNGQLDRVEGELSYLVNDLMEATQEMGLLNENLDLLTSEVGQLNCTLKQLGCSLEQLQCALKCLQCDLCALDKAIRKGQFKAFIIGVLVGIGIGAAIGGGGGGSSVITGGGGGGPTRVPIAAFPF